MEFFDILRNLTSRTPSKINFDSEEIDKIYNPFMVGRFVSMELDFIPDLMPINILYNIPKETHYRYLDNMIPKKFTRFNYIKKKSGDLSKEDEEILCKHFQCGNNDLKEIVKFCPQDEITKLLNRKKDIENNKKRK